MLVEWATKQRHSHFNAVRNAIQCIYLRKRATTTNRRRSSRFTANLSGQVHFLHYGLGSLQSTTLRYDLSEIDGASVLLHDAEATQFGPLTEEAHE